MVLPAFPRTLRWPLNAARWYTARVLWFPGCLLPPVAMSAIPERAPTWLEALVLVMSLAVAAILNERKGLLPGVYYQRRIVRGFANLVALSWLVTAAVVGAAAAGVAMAALFTIWLPITVASFVGTAVALWRGWLPPTTINAIDMAFLEANVGMGTPSRSTGSEPDPWDFNDRNDPAMAMQRELINEIKRGNDLAARQMVLEAGPRTVTQAASPAPEKRTAAPLAFIAAGALIVVVGAYLVGSKADAPQPPQWDQIHAEAAE